MTNYNNCADYAKYILNIYLSRHKWNQREFENHEYEVWSNLVVVDGN